MSDTHDAAPGTVSTSQQAESLFGSFLDPPAAARPRVWWHWMDGNVDTAGIIADLEWLAAGGAGGVQLFQGAMGTSLHTAERMSFGSSPWSSAVQCAAQTADRLGLELAVATSPGWSATGGPWVPPEAGMKKLVWGTTTATPGGVGTLPSPPAASGPFQDVPFPAVRHAPVPVPAHYEDVAVLAFPARAGHHPLSGGRISTGTAPVPGSGREPAELGDGAFWPVVQLPGENESTWAQWEFDSPVTVSSVRVGLPARRGFGSPPAPAARLEWSQDGHRFEPLADLPASAAPARSATFAPVTGTVFRLVLTRATGGSIPVAEQVQPMPAPNGAAPFELSAFQLFGGPRITRVEEKAGFAPVPDFYALEGGPGQPDDAVPVEEVLDLTEFLDGDGTLRWRPEAGTWTVVRFGCSLTGHLNAPAPVEATGLEVDKLDAQLVREYLEAYLDHFDRALATGSDPAGGIGALLSDSIESGPQNWTRHLREEFRQRRGYDPLPWLPAVTGILVEDVARSDAFLWDFRRTIAELLAENHYGTIADVAADRGLTYYAEALEDHRPQLGDDLQMRAHADVPMGAMWCYPPEEGPRPTYVADVLGAASVAHVYGKARVGAESMSAFGRPWMFTPRVLKPVLDAEFALGVNLVNLHTSPHQPEAVPAPGITLSPYLGQSFTRHETWAHAAAPWLGYMARCSHLLQQGTFAADIAYFIGEEAPVTGLFGDSTPGVPGGHGFDFLNLEGLQDHLTVADNGTLVSTGGVRYQVLCLGGSSRRMTLAAVERVRELLEAGATVLGARPESSPSAADDPTRWAAAVEEVWGGDRTRLVEVGTGATENLRRVLDSLGIEPDWQIHGHDDDVVMVLHRRTEAGDLYFLSNQAPRVRSLSASFRVVADRAELWDPYQLSRRPLSCRQEGTRTGVDLELAPFGSAFVLLSDGEPLPPSVAAPRPAATVDLSTGPWQLGLTGTGQSPATLDLDGIAAWSGPDVTAPSAEVRYFSGTGVYHRELEIESSFLATADRVLLELGEVHDLAEVRLNGLPVGTAWTYPFTLDITEALRPGTNRLEIAVTNAWANRLIGDAAGGGSERPGAQVFRPDASPLPAGLRGPVRLVATT